MRMSQGLTLEQLSARLDDLGHPLHFNSLSKIEQDKRRIDVVDLLAIAEALGVSAGVLLHGSPHEAEVVELVAEWSQTTREAQALDDAAVAIWDELMALVKAHPDLDQVVRDELVKAGVVEVARRKLAGLGWTWPAEDSTSREG